MPSVDAKQWLAEVFTPALDRESLAYTNDADLLRGQLAALHECGVLDDRVHAEARRRLENAVEAAWQKARFDVRPASSIEPASAPTIVLRRVLAVAQPLADVDRMSLVLTSVELWTNGVDLFLAGVPTAEAEQRVRQHEAELHEWAGKHRDGRSDGFLSPPQARGNRLYDVDIRLNDDVGTTYRSVGGSAGGSGTEWRLHRHHEPAVPENATGLTVEVTGDDEHVVGSLDLQL